MHMQIKTCASEAMVRSTDCMVGLIIFTIFLSSFGIELSSGEQTFEFYNKNFQRTRLRILLHVVPSSVTSPSIAGHFIDASPSHFEAFPPASACH